MLQIKSYALDKVLLASHVGSANLVEEEEGHPGLLLWSGESSKGDELLLLPFQKLGVHVCGPVELV